MDELSGQPMSGTSVLNARPKCNGGSGEEELLRSIGAVANLVREWKKCPQPRKRDFQEHLLDKLTNEMTSATVDLSYLFGNENAHLTIEERVAKWKFGELDRNNNGVSEGFHRISGCPFFHSKNLNFKNRHFRSYLDESCSRSGGS